VEHPKDPPRSVEVRGAEDRVGPALHRHANRQPGGRLPRPVRLSAGVNRAEPEVAVELDAELEPALFIRLDEDARLVVELGKRRLEASLEPPSIGTTKACPSCFGG
jgi:hypothetical protein